MCREHRACTVQGMDLTVLTGDDDLAIRTRRTRVLADLGVDEAGAERVDVAQDGGEALIGAVSSPSLFGGRRVVLADGMEALDETYLEMLLAAAPTSDAVVVGRASGALPPKVRENLKKVGTVTSLALPKGKGIAMRVEEMLSSAEVHLDAGNRRLLVERAGHDLDRLASVLRQLSITGITRPTRQQLELLLGTTSAPGVPWDLSDAVEDGNLARALTSSAGLEPIPALAYLASRVAQVGRVVDAGAYDPDRAAELLGLGHRFQAEKVVRAAKRLGEEGSRRAWDVVVAGDRAVKHAKDPHAAFDQVLVQLTACYQKGS